MFLKNAWGGGGVMFVLLHMHIFMEVLGRRDRQMLFVFEGGGELKSWI